MMVAKKMGAASVVLTGKHGSSDSIVYKSVLCFSLLFTVITAMKCELIRKRCVKPLAAAYKDMLNENNTKSYKKENMVYYNIIDFFLLLLTYSTAVLLLNLRNNYIPSLFQIYLTTVWRLPKSLAQIT